MGEPVIFEEGATILYATVCYTATIIIAARWVVRIVFNRGIIDGRATNDAGNETFNNNVAMNLLVFIIA